MSNVTENVDKCVTELEVMGKIVEKLLSEEEILYIMTNPEKLQKSCIENVKSYFAAESTSYSREQLLCRRKDYCFP